MKRIVSLALASSFGMALCFAGPKEDVQSAIKNLAQKPNYSWTSTSEMANSQFNMPALQGKTEKGGYTLLTQEFNDRTSTAVLKGEKGVMKGEEGWQTAEEMRQAAAGGGGGGQRRGFMGGMLLRTKPAAEQAEDLLSKVQDLKMDSEGVYSGKLTEAGVKELVSFRGRAGATQNQNRPEPKNAKGTVKFYVKDGTLTKYEFNVQYTMTFQDNDRDIDRTTKVEIKDIGSTKLSVPEEAKKKLAS